MNLLEMVQDILSSMDSDEVNSISDTTESLQVTRIIKTVYRDLCARAGLSGQETLFNLDASTDNTKPTVMYLPSGFEDLKSLRYNKATINDPEENFQTVTPMDWDTFADMMYSLNTDEDDVINYTLTVGASTIPILGKNTEAPTYYTTFDDQTVVFNSYDASVDTTLQSVKSIAFGQSAITWSNTDTFVPDLDAKTFTVLFNESKSLAFAELKQSQHQLAERSAQRGWAQMNTNKQQIKTLTEFQKLPNFGRK